MFNGEQLFDGNVNVDLCATVLHFHWRICMAVNAFPRELPNENSKARWRIGLYLEVTAMKDAVGTLMLNGCQGGSFFARTFDWFDCTRDDTFIITWSRFPDHMDSLVPLPTFRPRVNRKLLTLNEWWLWDDRRQTLGVQRPEWWDVTEDTVQEWFPEQRVPCHTMEKIKESLDAAGIMLERFRRIGMDTYGSP
ncbi:hypothetical protein QCA50_018707 [Cerrena zonata]|uniref:Uncharacterized protein n=1 Tax=Cerrena zonata TaxID=2478898 RepID=A0AAW0FCA3_9APHY